LSRAVSVVVRSTIRPPGALRKTNEVVSSRATVPSGITHSTRTFSRPVSPLDASTIRTCRLRPICFCFSAGSAVELFQKSIPLTSP
jgi:hypothetical protein